jgi:hypothetical protein
VIGPKKLSTIRQELQRALTATGEDPIRWLVARMTGSERQGSASAGESAVLRSLRRFLEARGRFVSVPTRGRIVVSRDQQGTLIRSAADGMVYPVRSVR